MKEIRLNNVVPEIFANRSDISSDIWLNDVVLERGKSYLIEAASGTGKSSLCSYLYGQRGDYRGVISFDGEDVMKYDINHWCNIRQHNISILFQDLRLFGELTALENVEIKNRITKHRTQQQIESWFEEMGIGDTHRSHSADEYVLRSEIAEGVAIYEDYLTQFTKYYGN